MEDENKIPSEKEIIEFYTGKLEILRLRSEFAELNARISEAELRRMKALTELGNMLPDKPDETNKHDANIQN